MRLLCHLEIVVIEADQSEAERDAEHDPHIGIERIGPQQCRHHEAGEDHQPTHGGRALLGNEMRLRPVGADRLALALPDAQVVDDPGAEQEHEQCGCDHRAAGAERNVAKYIQSRYRGRCVDKPIEHSKPPYTATSSRAALSGNRFCNALTIAFMREPSEPLIMTASPARIVETTCDSSAAELSA